MEITVNGKKITVDSGITLENMLSQQGFDKTKVAIEKNREIIPRSNYHSTPLCKGDVIEVLTFVGGG